MSAAPPTDEAFRALYPFQSRFHTIGPHRLHYLDEGSGEPVVMLHGNPTWSFYYRRLAAELRATHRVIVPDHMGCGFSDKPQDYPYTLATHAANLKDLLDSLKIGRLNLVVHDWGGPIGLACAVRDPDRIARLVILNTSGFLSRRIPLRIAACRIPAFGALAVRGFNAFARAALSMAVCHRERMTPDVRAGYLRPYDSWANRVAVLRFVQDIPMSPAVPSHGIVAEIEGGLAKLKAKPMLIQWGARDWCFDLSFLDGWRRRFPEASVDAYEDAGHYVLEDAYERVIPRIKSFLLA